VGEITKFQKLFLSPGFLAYGGTLIAASLAIVFYFAPKFVLISSCPQHVVIYVLIGMGRKTCCGTSWCAA
jgi:hypothetical protein